MEDMNIWIEVLKQAPALAVLVFLVLHFLKHIREITSDFRSTIEEVNVTIADQHSFFRERTERSLDKNTIALAQNTKVLEQFNHVASNGPVCGNFRSIKGDS